MPVEESLEAKVSRWKKTLAPHLRPLPQPDAGRATLLLIDPQVRFYELLRPILPDLGPVVERFRSRRLPVFFTRHRHVDPTLDGGMMAEWWDDLLIEGSPDAELIPELQPQKDERLIEKCRYSAFFGTALEEELRDRNVGDVVIGGVMTNLCCETTARDAYMRDFRVFFLIDGTGTCSEEYHLATLRNLAYGFAYLATCREMLALI